MDARESGEQEKRMFQNKDRAREAGIKAADKVLKKGGSAALAALADRATAARVRRDLDNWTRDNVGLD